MILTKTSRRHNFTDADGKRRFPEKEARSSTQAAREERDGSNVGRRPWGEAESRSTFARSFLYSRFRGGAAVVTGQDLNAPTGGHVSSHGSGGVRFSRQSGGSRVRGKTRSSDARGTCDLDGGRWRRSGEVLGGSGCVRRRGDHRSAIALDARLWRRAGARAAPPRCRLTGSAPEGEFHDPAETGAQEDEGGCAGAQGKSGWRADYGWWSWVARGPRADCAAPARAAKRDALRAGIRRETVTADDPERFGCCPSLAERGLIPPPRRQRVFRNTAKHRRWREASRRYRVSRAGRASRNPGVEQRTRLSRVKQLVPGRPGNEPEIQACGRAGRRRTPKTCAAIPR